MIKQNRYSYDLLVCAAFIIAFIFMIAAFSEKSIKQENNPINQELAIDLGSIKSSIVESAEINLPSFEKEWFLSFDFKSIKLSGINLKLYSDNSITKRSINSLQNKQYFIIPKFTCKYYYHLFSRKSNELPVLS